MTWAAPWALGLALAVVLPVMAHLWSRRRPVLQPISTLRFLRASSPVSRRLQQVQDWPLLLLRCAIVMAIGAAAAGPTLATALRKAAWGSRLHRVIVVDASVAPQTRQALEQWQQGAASSEVVANGVATIALPEAVARAAAAALETRAEIVILWDGRRTSLPPRAIEDIPQHIGVRLESVAVPLPTAPLGGGFTIVGNAADEPVATRLSEIATGAQRRSDLVVRLLLPGAPTAPVETRPATVEARSMLDALAADPRVREAAERSRPDPRSDGSSDDDRVLASDVEGRVLLAGRAADARVDLQLAATPGSPLALSTVVAVRDALERPELADGANRWSPEDIARVVRDGRAPASPPLPGGLDTRACWGAALALLFVEAWWRRRPLLPRNEVRDAA